jgi:DNA-directed RNA polymerase specialized sigma54-like protein
MNTILCKPKGLKGRQIRNCLGFQAGRRSREGSAVVVLLVLLTLMVALAAANTATLNRLRQRVKIVEQRQVRRLNGLPSAKPPPGLSATNSTPPK